ncbi:hypothetical protein BkAM31D_05850 [Halalkalibacter krulwichiae]|uniref:Uncharacterized protein n=2 Tax=Halalkalibacter krulwichiae TaxID=199441 RepID=A0A1X9MCX8_9BACI|nr:hypothetical protein [Halalkalibacter krulwichiae]ARK29411.1 hypothetical protein BkAM31D_05850 [Halalkalibacter krulwichiae]
MALLGYDTSAEDVLLKPEIRQDLHYLTRFIIAKHHLAHTKKNPNYVGGEIMPKKSTSTEVNEVQTNPAGDEKEIEKLNRLLASVLDYLSDDEVEEIDIEYLLTNTEGLREWWDQYRESNRKKIEEEIKKSLGELSLEELESIHDKIKEKE